MRRARPCLSVALGALLFLLPLAAADALDYVYSDADTYRVMDAWGHSGDTVVVPIDFVNEEPVSGLWVRVEYDSSQMTAVGVTIESTRLEGLGWFVFPDLDVSAEVRFVGVDMLSQHFLPSGSGPIALILFELISDAMPGVTAVRFEDDPEEDPPIQNTFADSLATANFVPVQIDGRVRICEDDNCPPCFDVISGGYRQVVNEGDTLKFVVSGHDVDGDHLILFAVNLPIFATFPPVEGDSAVAGTFVFTPDSSQAGERYSVVFTVSDDGSPALMDVDTVEIAVSPAGVSENSPPCPQTFALRPTYPNPFNAYTVIRYSIPERKHWWKEPERTSLKVYNLLGHEVRALVSELQHPGDHCVTWDGRDNCGREAPSGVYLYRLTVGTRTMTRRTVLLR